LASLLSDEFGEFEIVMYRDEEGTEVHGHITSLAVARTHRKLGLATKLMNAARK